MHRRAVLLLAAVSAVTLHVPFAIADTYPSKPIRLIVPFAPGGGVDAIARIVSQELSKQLGQPVVIENKGGAGGAIGTVEMIRAAPDGYTLVMASPSITGALPAFNPNAGYNPLTDVTAIVNLAASPVVVAVNSKFPAKNFAEFVAELKSKPDKYSYGTPGSGGIGHLQMEVFKSLTGTSILHVPFKGAGPALTAVVGGQVDIIRDALFSAAPFIKEGRLVPFAVMSDERVKELPDVPTFKEVGLPQLSRMDHYGILGPKGMPKEVVDKINSAARATLADPTVRRNIEASGSLVVGSTPEQFASEIKEVYEQLRKVVVDRGLKIDQ